VDAVGGAEKRNVLGVMVNATDYHGAVSRIIEAAEQRRAFGATALAVHGVMTSVSDPELRYRINQLNLVTPDGQPVRWALNWIHGARLRDRVAGPSLMLRLCEVAAERRLPIYLYGSRPDVLQGLVRNLESWFPALKIAGAQPSRFRSVTAGEMDAIRSTIVSSGARMVFIGLGCPRQEVFVYEQRHHLQVPLVAVGAAFDFHAGGIRRPRPGIQRLGLEWTSRLAQQPRQLWRRYLTQNPVYPLLVAAQASGLWSPDPGGSRPAVELRYG
jgi:N-acetylglucosaminyldiphosphoundecaprenol N-acetyl-beta-D-mannosaminyltransferase